MSNLSLPSDSNAMSSSATTSVMLLEDSDLVRLTWHRSIERIEGLVITGSFSHVDDAIAHLRSHTAHIVLLDLDVNGKSGLEVLHFIAKHCTQVKALVVTNHCEEMYRRYCLEAGAYAFFEKGRQFMELFAMLEECARPAGKAVVHQNTSLH